MNFEQAAVEMFPELANSATITRRQVTEVVAKYKVKYPNHITNPNNNVARGVFKFNAELSVGAEYGAPAVPVVLETDEELDARIADTYDNLEILVNSVADGQTKSMVVSGHAGIGKSYTVRQTLEQNINSDFTFIKGYVKPTGIFKLLWENRFEGQTIVFDDADAVFQDEVGLNLLKGALELTKTRRIAWLSEKEFISEDGEQIPRYFDYEGTIIFLTNLNFNDLISRGNKLAPHLQALESRSIYFDLQINTNRELMTRIKQVVMSSSILSDRGISKADETKLMEYLTDNVDRLKELSLRTVEKLAVLYLASPDKWINLANSVMIKR
jgi:hypothetical protein